MAVLPQQVKSGLLMGLPFCGWPSGVMSPGLAFPGSPLNPLLGAAAYQPGEGAQGNPFLAPSVSTSKSESPGPLGEKHPSAPSPAVELARNQDHATPLPIPEGRHDARHGRHTQTLTQPKRSSMLSPNVLMMNVVSLCVCVCVCRDAVWLVEGVRPGGAARPGEGSSQPGRQREGPAETDPKA